LPQNKYLEFIEALSVLLKLNAKKMTRLAFINADYQRLVRGLFEIIYYKYYSGDKARYDAHGLYNVT